MRRWATRFLGALLGVVLLAGLAPAPRGHADEVSAPSSDRQVVRVAFPQVEGFSMVDEDGRRSGVLYDWLVEIAKYTGWTYEFVDGDVDGLLAATAAGEVDLSGGMYYREQLLGSYDYSHYSTGANCSLLLCPDEDASVSSFDARTLEGKTIGVFQGADEKVRRLESYLDFNGLHCQVLRLDRSSFESCLEDGTADLMLGSDTEVREGCRVVARFEGEPHYLALPKGSALLPALDQAMAQIYAADGSFAEELRERYFPDAYPDPIEFTEADRSFIAQAPIVRVAVPAGRYPLYYQQDGAYRGVVKDLFDLVSERTGLTFRFVHADTYAAALDLVSAGEADVAGCFMDDAYAAAERGLAVTKPYAFLDEVVFKNKATGFDSEARVVAQIEGRCATCGSASSIVLPFPSYAECLEAVDAGRADQTSMPASFAESLFAAHTYENVAPATADHRSTEFSIALPEPVDSSLYSVLSKAVNSFSEEELDAVMARNAVQVDGTAMDLRSLVSRNPLLASGLFFVFFLLLVVIAAVVAASRVRGRMMEIKLGKAEEASRAKADFLSRMSHEIRTPMNAIIGLSSVASLSGEATPAIRSSLEKINTSAQFLLSLVNDILDMTKIENDKMSIEAAPFRLRSLAERLESMFGIQAQEKGVSFEARCQPDVAVVGDDVRIQQVLANLLSNAFKFTDAGGSVVLAIEQRACADGRGSFWFGVSDDGAGIRPQDIERIFASFEQAAENHRNAQGTGLGLAISSNLVRLMGGRLEASSRLGEGSVFSFVLDLPLAQEPVEAACGDGHACAADAPEASLAGAHALLAEDNDLNAEIAEALLDMEGVTVDRAADGREAVDLFAAAPAGRYDFVLMDVKMPVLDGLAAAREIRALDRADALSVPIVALTANTFQEDRDEAAAAGMDGFIPKPFDAQQLYGTLRRLLRPSEE